VGYVHDYTQAAAQRDTCDVMVVTDSPDSHDALALLQALGANPPAPAVIVMGLPNLEPLILRYLEAGAAGCIRTQDSSEELVRAIRLAADRQIALSPDLLPLVLKRVASLGANRRENSPQSAKAHTPELTRREREILELIAQGYGNREIARQLTIELGTAKNHVHNILDKLNVRSRRDAALYYALSRV
jgi:DNA-binding NarL/FixJ family response regulator